MALSGLPARKVREPEPGFSKVPHCTCEKASASCRCPLRGLSTPSHRRTGDPGRAARSCAHFSGKPDQNRSQNQQRQQPQVDHHVPPRSCFGFSAFPLSTECGPRWPAALPGPLCGGEGRSTGPQGHWHGCQSFFARTGVLSKNPAGPHGLAGHGCPASAKRGGLLFWLLFSWPRKRKVTRPPREDESSLR